MHYARGAARDELLAVLCAECLSLIYLCIYLRGGLLIAREELCGFFEELLQFLVLSRRRVVLVLEGNLLEVLLEGVLVVELLEVEVVLALYHVCVCGGSLVRFFSRERGRSPDGGSGSIDYFLIH